MFAPIGSHVNESEKKIVKLVKIVNFEKKSGLEIWWIESYPQNLTQIHAVVSEKSEFTDGQTDDGRLCHDSSSADNAKQS